MAVDNKIWFRWQEKSSSMYMLPSFQCVFWDYIVTLALYIDRAARTSAGRLDSVWRETERACTIACVNVGRARLRCAQGVRTWTHTYVCLHYLRHADKEVCFHYCFVEKIEMKRAFCELCVKYSKKSRRLLHYKLSEMAKLRKNMQRKWQMKRAEW